MDNKYKVITNLLKYPEGTILIKKDNGEYGPDYITNDDIPKISEEIIKKGLGHFFKQENIILGFGWDQYGMVDTRIVEIKSEEREFTEEEVELMAQALNNLPLKKREIAIDQVKRFIDYACSSDNKVFFKTSRTEVYNFLLMSYKRYYNLPTLKEEDTIKAIF